MKKLSLVIASKNDLYNAKHTTPLFRLQTSLKQTLSNSENTNLEIIIVDYGSDEKIEDTLEINDKRIKFIYVDKEECAKYQTPFNEVKCINRGAKNATGNFVGRLDQDTFVGKEFFDWFNTDECAINNFYFSGRQESNYFYNDSVPCELEYTHTVGYAKRNWFKTMVGILLIPTHIWIESSGYNEKNIFFNHMEHEFITRLKHKYSLINLGSKLNFPFYHLHHDRDSSEQRKSNKHIKNAIHKNQPFIANEENWG